ncbi:hypothetical protein FH972_009647 [Carpinus fangiana]|uniref:Uncharacterized protein n=1 Tax=Carpinus fangiana TaxID=176857 RepID=A0A660KMV1_9ROSI|nr:hypothetical protein FH972_009647 [Carpinus fangiana]
MGRAENSDLSELRSFYQLHVEDINDLQNAAVIDRPQLTKAYCTSGILCEVLKPLIARQIAQTRTAENLGETFFDSEVLPSMLLEISPILHVASEVVKSNPRVAYLCKFMLSFANN